MWKYVHVHEGHRLLGSCCVLRYFSAFCCVLRWNRRNATLGILRHLAAPHAMWTLETCMGMEIIPIPTERVFGDVLLAVAANDGVEKSRKKCPTRSSPVANREPNDKACARRGKTVPTADSKRGQCQCCVVMHRSPEKCAVFAATGHCFLVGRLSLT